MLVIFSGDIIQSSMARNFLPPFEPRCRDHPPLSGRRRAFAFPGLDLQRKDPRVRLALSRHLENGNLLKLRLLLPHPAPFQSSIDSRQCEKIRIIELTDYFKCFPWRKVWIRLVLVMTKTNLSYIILDRFVLFDLSSRNMRRTSV